MATSNPYLTSPPEEEGFFTSLALAPVRGVAGAAEGVVNLFGAGVEDNFGLGHSQGLVPGLVEGVTQFLAGFIPGAGLLGKVGGFAKLGKYASLAKGVAAGAIADFTVYNGSDPRLSNLIQSVPELSNSVTEFLASKDSDSEILGRMKNVLEGAGLGAVTDGVLHIFKKMRGYNEAVSKGEHGKAAEIQKEIEATSEELLGAPTPEAQATIDAVESAKSGEIPPESMGLEALGVPQDPVKAVQEPKPAQVATNAEQPQAMAASSAQVEAVSQPEAKGAPEEITQVDAKKRVAYDPLQGDVVLVNTNDTSGLMRGLTQWDSFTREPGSRLSIVQLKDGILTLRANSAEARRMFKRPKGMADDVWEKNLTDIAKFRGYDAVKFRKNGNYETVILNEDAIHSRINVMPGQPFWQEKAIGEAIKDPSIVAKHPVEQAAYDTGLSPESAKAVADTWESLKHSPDEALDKIAGIANYAKMGDRDQRKFYKMVVDQFDWKEAVPEGKTWDDLVVGAAEETARALGQDPHVWAETLRVSSDNVEQAANRAVGTRYFLKMQLKQLHGLAQDIVNGTLVKDITTGKALTTDQALEMLGRNIDQIQTVGKMYGRLRTAFGRGLNSFRIGVDQMAQHELMRSLDARGGPKQVMKLAAQIIEEYKTSPDHVSRLIMAKNRKSRVWGALTDWYMFSLLSAPKTLTTNIVGSTATALYKPLETSFGAWVGKKLLSPERAAEMERTVAVNMKRMSIMRQMFVEAALTRKNLGEFTQNAMDAAKASFKTGDSTLIPGAGAFDKTPTNGISAENIGALIGKNLDPAAGMGKAIEMIGKTTRLPGRILQASDEFIKQVAYHAHIKAEIMQQAAEKGLKGAELESWVESQMRAMSRDGAALTEQSVRNEADQLFTRERFTSEAARQEHIQSYVDKALEDAGVFKRSALAQDALKFAREVTFTTALDPQRGPLAHAGNLLAQFAERHPATMFFAPFIRTPLNILSFTADRLPVPFLNKDFLPMVQYLASKTGLPVGLNEARNSFVQQLMHADPQVAAEAMGRASTAVASTATLGMLALSGVITGRGPEDPQQAKVLRDTGWQPYSIKIGDTYVSYQRLDPFASLLSFYADWADIARYGGNEQDLGELATGMFTATLTNLQSKSYLSGLIDLVDMVHDPVNKFPDTVGRIAGSLAVPNVLGAARSFTDPHLPELNGIMDRVRSRIPFLAGGMDKQRNALGEPLTKNTYGTALRIADGLAGYMAPIQTNTTTSDVVNQELADLAFPFNPPQPIRLGVDLREYKNDRGQSAYDRWQEITGEISIGGRTLRSSMERLIKSHKYQSLAHDGLDKMDLDSPRVVLIKQLLGKYRRAAERQMLQEFPDVSGVTRDKRLARAALNSGADLSSVQSLLTGGR